MTFDDYLLELFYLVDTELTAMDLPRLRKRGPEPKLHDSEVIAILLRSQLRPLARIANEAAAIGPNHPDQRITDVGSRAAELVQLRNSINTMLARLSKPSTANAASPPPQPTSCARRSHR